MNLQKNNFKQNSYKIKKIDNFKISLIILIFIITLTISIFWYNLYIEKQNNNLQSEIQVKNTAINNLENQKEIIAYSIYTKNKWLIKTLENYSKQTLFINHLFELSNKYKIFFKWYNFSKWKLQTTVIASSNNIVNYRKTANFIKNYREDKNALFKLDFIKNISIKNNQIDNVFNITFELKNNLENILIQKNKENEKKEKELNKQKLELKKRLEELKRKKLKQ